MRGRDKYVWGFIASVMHTPSKSLPEAVSSGGRVHREVTVLTLYRAWNQSLARPVKVLRSSEQGLEIQEQVTYCDSRIRWGGYFPKGKILQLSRSCEAVFHAKMAYCLPSFHCLPCNKTRHVHKANTTTSIRDRAHGFNIPSQGYSNLEYPESETFASIFYCEPVDYGLACWWWAASPWRFSTNKGLGASKCCFA